jgi:hypothetical protein
MRAIRSAKEFVSRIVDHIKTARAEPGFYCAQCERWARCGLPSSSDCIPMLTQLELRGSDFKQGPSSVAAVWPHGGAIA